jgi:UDP-glucose 6-dehydrogenase
MQKGVEVSGVSLDRIDGAVHSAPDWIFLCLPTPTVDCKQDISAITDVLAKYDGQAVNVVIRSTVLPGT